jgi:hypothetical protein
MVFGATPYSYICCGEPHNRMHVPIRARLASSTISFLNKKSNVKTIL